MVVIETSSWEALADKALADERLSRAEALAVLQAPDEENRGRSSRPPTRSSSATT